MPHCVLLRVESGQILMVITPIKRTTPSPDVIYHVIDPQRSKPGRGRPQYRLDMPIRPKHSFG